ncbi:hypothetical protein [Streptomyces roseifaciens]|uniref:hypothetical protein n=1 Tax=Streptomyces roseifaciens TaxID=1488406 RepID=UPI0007180145|nr:hypothetical protein [Streptomyces roseifaciens]
MPAPYEAELTRLITTSLDSEVATTKPNVCTNGPAPKFQVCVEAVAGTLIGNSCLPYTLHLCAIDECKAAPNEEMSKSITDQTFSPNHGWKPYGCQGKFVKKECFVITVPNLDRCRVFRYIATLCDKQGKIATFIHSAPFILVPRHAGGGC